VEFHQNKIELESKGFSITPQLYSGSELGFIKELFDKNASFSENVLVYSIRKLLKTIPELSTLLFNKNLIELINELGGPDYFLTKSIYFDKPENSNWFVSYHQDLSISVSDKFEIDGYKNWTVKKNQFGVQPPIEVLEKTITLRIHLDNTDQSNGALKVILNSHKKGITRFEKEWAEQEEEAICNVREGAVMLMKPLTFHASKRSQSGNRRRVIHLEFCNQELESPLVWSEKST
jgi:ectoine hydroxylase-related dioxygenase (phytanoyl-CoA dioxygenase family)